ncbi:DUF1501 domain-containing protein [Nocardioides sp. CBS4Y-1]|uniref:DUF1501 domain-containing protein n=2 Tax=Nocardioides acrostichi TaxID=2784339 RepID=A0A930V1Q3_9ACTN|nr:DUF1501 domain-containing protein [Nocardioides acrostichi]
MARLTRRGVLRGLALAGGAATFGSAVVTAAPASATEGSSGSVLVVLSMRGAADGLSLVVPHGDPVYYAARPRIGVPRERLIAADAFYGLHPALAPLLPLWNGGRLAAVHATGLAAPNRSHFSAMEEVEDANPGSTVREGWLNRVVGLTPGDSPLQAVHMGETLPSTALFGPAPTFATRSVDDVKITGQDQYDTGGRRSSLETLWSRHSGTDAKGLLARGMGETFSAVDGFSPARAVPDTSGSYPRSDLAQALADVARTIKADVGVEVFTVDHGDWDMHSGLGTLEWGRMGTNAGEWAAAIAAFFADLGRVADRVTLVTMSEFGRRVAENDNYGLDHGYGNVMFVAGAGVAGGRYYGTFPGLAATLDADLLVTTDYRQVLGEIVTRRFPAASLSRVFPGLSYSPVGFMGA